MSESGNMAPKKKRKPVRIAHELSRNRRRAIQKALAEHQVEDRAEWDRASEWSDYRFYRKLVKKGTIRTIELPLLEVSIGDPSKSPKTKGLIPNGSRTPINFFPVITTKE